MQETENNIYFARGLYIPGEDYNYGPWEESTYKPDTANLSSLPTVGLPLFFNGCYGNPFFFAFRTKTQLLLEGITTLEDINGIEDFKNIWERFILPSFRRIHEDWEWFYEDKFNKKEAHRGAARPVVHIISTTASLLQWWHESNMCKPPSWPSDMTHISSPTHIIKNLQNIYFDTSREKVIEASEDDYLPGIISNSSLSPSLLRFDYDTPFVQDGSKVVAA